MIALPFFIAFSSKGLGMPWTTGITASAPHSGQLGIFLVLRRRLALAGMEVVN